MQRQLLHKLLDWKTNPLRMPLILRGARQVGKSWLVDEFGKQFKSFVKINFDKQEKVKHLFEGDLHIQTLLEKLSLYTGERIIPGETLLFFDEAQECENCLKALRYFKEECAALHVIAAGSLIDFTLEKIGVPVGRVQFMYLYPMSFAEFLIAHGRDDLNQHIYLQQSDPLIHAMINEFLKNYLWLGGMPAVVSAWLHYKNATQCQELQDAIILSYKQDFEKYARKNQIDNIAKVFESIPLQLGRKFKFTHVDHELKTPPIKQALLLLIKAGVAHPCYHASGQTQLLGAEKDTKKFKVFFSDVGLAQRMLGLDLKQWVVEPLTLKWLGSIAEQLVAQEFISYSRSNAPADLYYWHREEKKSNAEVDFLFVKNGLVIPVEVKAGVKGGMKSLSLFLDSHPQSPYGLKIANNGCASQTLLEEIPLYGIDAWLRSPKKLSLRG